MMYTFSNQIGTVARLLLLSSSPETRLVQIPNVDKGGERSFVLPESTVIKSRGFCSNPFTFDCLSRFFSDMAGYFIV